MKSKNITPVTKQQFIYCSDAIFEIGLRRLVKNLRGEKRLPLLSFPGTQMAKQYLKKPTKKNRQKLVKRLGNEEFLDNFQCITVLQFIEWYKQQRKKHA